MKIKENIERDCCDWYKDLEVYEAPTSIQNSRQSLKFCKCCGQIWYYVRNPGEMEAGWEKLDIGKAIKECPGHGG